MIRILVVDGRQQAVNNRYGLGSTRTQLQIGAQTGLNQPGQALRQQGVMWTGVLHQGRHDGRQVTDGVPLGIIGPDHRKPLATEQLQPYVSQSIHINASQQGRGKGWRMRHGRGASHSRVRRATAIRQLQSLWIERLHFGRIDRRNLVQLRQPFLRAAKISNDSPSLLVQQNVVGLDVVVHFPLAVQFFQPLGNIAQQRQGAVYRRSLCLDQLSEGVLHGIHVDMDQRVQRIGPGGKASVTEQACMIECHCGLGLMAQHVVGGPVSVGLDGDLQVGVSGVRHYVDHAKNPFSSQRANAMRVQCAGQTGVFRQPEPAFQWGALFAMRSKTETVYGGYDNGIKCGWSGLSSAALPQDTERMGTRRAWAIGSNGLHQGCSPVEASESMTALHVHPLSNLRMSDSSQSPGPDETCEKSAPLCKLGSRAVYASLDVHLTFSRHIRRCSDGGHSGAHAGSWCPVRG